MNDSTPDGLLLRGLDGSNPLAFLAALGTLRTLTLALPGEKVRMSWEKREGAWRPKVWCSLCTTPDALMETLDDELRKAATRACFAVADNLNLPAAAFRSHLLQCVEAAESLTTRPSRVDADFLAAFGSEVIFDDKGVMTDTALRTMSGAGHQHFLKFFRELVLQTDSEHLRRSLLMAWDYADEGRGMSLRWDPIDDRRYALRWGDPSGDPSKTMRGANRLAMEALPLLPTMPNAGRLLTTAFEGKGARDTFLTWPIWTTSLTTDVVGSMLAQACELRDRPESRVLLGIAALYTSARITTGKFRNFTPGVPV